MAAAPLCLHKSQVITVSETAFRLIQYVFRINAIKLLLEAFPKAAGMRNRVGEIPLHYACDSEDFDAGLRRGHQPPR